MVWVRQATRKRARARAQRAKGERVKRRLPKPQGSPRAAAGHDVRDDALRDHVRLRRRSRVATRRREAASQPPSCAHGCIQRSACEGFGHGLTRSRPRAAAARAAPPGRTRPRRCAAPARARRRAGSDGASRAPRRAARRTRVAARRSEVPGSRRRSRDRRGSRAGGRHSGERRGIEDQAPHDRLDVAMAAQIDALRPALEQGGEAQQRLDLLRARVERELGEARRAAARRPPRSAADRPRSTWNVRQPSLRLADAAASRRAWSYSGAPSGTTTTWR